MKSEPAHYAVIERIAALAKSEIRDAAQCARFELGLVPMIYLERQRSIALPRFKCPECGGQLFAYIEEWETADGQPVGLMVACYAEFEELFSDVDETHMHMWHDWEGVTHRAERFVRRRVRVVT